jgi:two-component system, cell cycle sensor histidine kinase and response regulator CckA
MAREAGAMREAAAGESVPGGFRRPAVLEPLASRITLLISLLLIGIMGSMLWLAHTRVVAAVGDSELARLQASANQLATTLSAQARRLALDVSRVAALPEVKAIPATPRARGTGLDAVLGAERTRSPLIRTIAVWSASGRVLASSGPDIRDSRSAPRPPLFSETMTTPSVGPLESVGDTVIYSLTAPIVDFAGRTKGYVTVTRQLTEGRESAQLLTGLVGRDAQVLLGNEEGDFLSDLTRPVTGRGGLPEVGLAGRYRDQADLELLGAVAAVPETPWKVVVEVPRATVLRAASRFTLDSALFGGIFIIVGAFLSWLAIRHTMRPLDEVTAAARDISNGDLSRRVIVRGNDEVATLAGAFNHMIERVAQSAHDLGWRASQLERANKEINESESKYRTLFEHLPDGILVHRDQQVLFANPSAVRMLGAATESEIVNRPVLDFVLPTDRHIVRERIGRIVAENQPVPATEVRLQRLDRKVATVEATSMPLRIGGQVAVQTILHDVSERRLLEEQFRQSQKMDAVGRLAGGVAHDFNNLLTVIQAHAEFALAPGESDDARRADIEEIRRTAQSAARLTRQLLTFSRKQTLSPTAIDLNDAIAGMLGMVQRLIGDNIEVVVSGGADLAEIWADPGQIQQILLNLAVNARDAMPGGGVLRFETANISVGEGYTGAAASSIPPGDYVMLAVQDTGIGMTEEIRSRVFEPFFTTKQPGQGTGLGLSTVYGIVHQSQGHIWVYSEPGMGTAFKVLFPPYANGEPPKRHAIVDDGVAPEVVGSLLVVEDDAGVRAAVVRALRGAGFTVTEATEADGALDVIARDPTIELLITDMVMPGKPGVTLLSEVRALRPMLPAIILSGYSGESASELWRVPEHAIFVEKPVSPAEIIRRVKQLLASRD